MSAFIEPTAFPARSARDRARSMRWHVDVFAAPPPAHAFYDCPCRYGLPVRASMRLATGGSCACRCHGVGGMRPASRPPGVWTFRR